MDFSHVNQGSRKSGKFVLVAALHVALGIMFVNGVNTRKLALPHDEGITVTLPPDTIDPPPKPVEPPPVNTNLQPPKLFVPVVEAPVTLPPETTIIVDHGNPVEREFPPPHTGTEIGNPPPAVTPARPPAMHTAVLADANACTLPAYPRSAVLNEETGTTTLALMVGTDGRVSSARVERSSGFRDLDRAAVSALSLCQFKPATNNGVPEAGWAKLAYVWTLD